MQLHKDNCFYCGVQVIVGNYNPHWQNPERLRLKNRDHLTPVSRGGDNSADNTVIACLGCNSRKATKTLEEFRLELETIAGGDIKFFGEHR